MKKITLIIPTLKRKYSTIRLINSLSYDRELIHEVVIVEQEINNRNEYIRSAKKLDLRIKYLFYQNHSTSLAKNIGAKQSESDLILFLDDDVVAEKGLIRNHILNYENPKVGAVCGRSITVDQKIEPFREDVGRISALGKFSDGYSSTIKQEIDTVIGCNASWRKSVFMKLGGFDERFTGNAMREESDLSLRAKKAGYKILFEPLALVRHLREPSGGARKTEGRMQWYFDFFSNETYFFLKHFKTILLPIYLLNRMEWAMRCMFGFGREVSLRSMITPIQGVVNGVKKYSEYTYEYRN